MSNSAGLPPDSLPTSAKTQSPQSYLFSSIIKLNLGEQAAFVYATILGYDRLNLSQLSQYTKIKPSILKKILVSLIQLECVSYFKETNYLTKKSQVLYFPRDDGCWKMIYSGDIISGIKKDYSEMHATIVQNILIAGHLTIEDYIQNFTRKSEITQIEKAFSMLTREKWLIPINELHFQNKYDVFYNIYKQKTTQYNSEHAGAKTMSQAKKLTAVKEMTRDRYLSVLANEELHLKLYKTPSASKGGKHSHHVGDDDNDTDDASNYFQKVNIKLPLTFNFERFQKRLRSMHLVSEVKHKIGVVSAKIYAIALNRLEAKSIDLIPGDIELEEFLANVGQTTVGLDPHLFNELKKRLQLRDQERGFNFSANDILKDMKSGQGRKFGLVESDLIDSVVDPSSYLSTLKRKRQGGNANSEDDEGDRPSKKVKLEAIDSILDDDNNSDDDNFANNSKGGFQNGNSSAKDHRLLILYSVH
ncbi:unnamed protein product [Ambrosiozyma monospora]|uniref:Unnamed protein product n=1 Tax=Ambrosiozyma monospora TaxID=43982 RepID=A0ACB5T3Z6_AMBMO|nr:unnamed protein product [Ambrosiozyma monospora]